VVVIFVVAVAIGVIIVARVTMRMNKNCRGGIEYSVEAWSAPQP